tara:strand:- start:2315 stop:2893 length:579 start_codon:yes stop_codon:yes gene_type:complete
MIEPAFIIGNGLSRQKYDLNRLVGQGCTFGCNALYRDFTPDYLVAIDDKIIEEITQSDYPMNRFIVPPNEEQYEPAEHNPGRPRSNAGMNACFEAIKKDFKDLFLFGFDFILEDNISVKNIYDGSKCYGPETRANYNDNGNRAKYFEYMAKKNPDVNFKFVLPRDIRIIHNIDSSNVTGIHYEDFDPGWDVK